LNKLEAVPGPARKPRAEVMSSAVRMLRVLELVATEPFEWTLSELAKSMSMSKATAHRVMATLVDAGFATQEPVRNRYSVSGKALEVGTAYLRHSPAYRAAFPVMNDLAKQVEGMVHLGVWDNDSILFLRSYGQPSRYYLYADSGDRRPLHANALGKAMLAWSPASEVERIMSQGCASFTRNTITTLAQMNRDLARVRERGYAINEEEWSLGLRAVASAIFDARGQVAASICIGGPANRMTPASVKKCGAMVRDAGNYISSQLGFRAQARHIGSRRPQS
jgi:DNA-binding IclR family transcriptional regulator